MPPKAVFDVARAAQLHTEGMRLTDIAAMPGMPCSAVVARHMHEHGYRVYVGRGRPPAIPADDLRRLHWEENLPAEDIGRLYGCGVSTVRRQLVANKLNKGRGNARKKRGPENPNWRGGVTTDGRGYVLIRDPSHPNARGNGYVAAHRKAGADKLGRPLLSTEEAHHIDGNKKNNSPDNIMVIERGPHQRLHAEVYRELLKLRAEVARLTGCGHSKSCPARGDDWKVVG